MCKNVRYGTLSFVAKIKGVHYSMYYQHFSKSTEQGTVPDMWIRIQWEIVDPDPDYV